MSGKSKKGNPIRERSSNFTKTEKFILTNLVDKYKNIIECKKTDTMTSKAKNAAWKNLSIEFNAKGVSSSDNRSAEKLKVLWDNLKRLARKHYGDMRLETYRTGGGSNKIKDDDLLSQVKGVIGPLISPIENVFDDDSIEDSEVAEFIVGEDGELLNAETENTNNADTLSTADTVLLQPENIPNKSEEVEMLEDDEMIDWSEWSPAMLRTKKHSALVVGNESQVDSGTSIQKSREDTATPGTSCRKSVNDTAASTVSNSMLKRKAQDDLHTELRKRRMQKSSQQKGSPKHNKLIETKIEYLNILKKEAGEKAEIEKKLLQQQVIKQELEIALLRKKLEKSD